MNARKPFVPAKEEGLLPQRFPKIPESVVNRFGEEARQWQREIDDWYKNLILSINRPDDTTLAKLEELGNRITAIESKL